MYMHRHTSDQYNVYQIPDTPSDGATPHSKPGKSVSMANYMHTSIIPSGLPYHYSTKHKCTVVKL